MTPASSPRHFWRPSALLVNTLLASTLVFLLLELWRPYYFLTDDNLAGDLPFLTEIGRHLKSGQSPFFSDYLFGGHYNFLRDATYFGWSPVNLLVSLLADTPGRFLMCELVAFLNLMLATAGFLTLARSVREELRLEVPDLRLGFYTLSFVYSTFILTCGPSWLTFLTNQAALPWLALGLWQKAWRSSLGILILFSLYQALGGHCAVMISNGLILTLFALVVCPHRRSWHPLARWVLANLAAFVLILPLLLPALGGFLHSQRAGGLSVEMLHSFAMPAVLFPISLLFGNFFEMAAYLSGMDMDHLFYFPRLPTLLACAAATCILPCVLQRRRWTLLEGCCAGLVCLLAVMAIRPIVITQFMSHVPILRSMRWPFREILQFLFFFHLLLVLRPSAGTVAFQNRLACVSLVFFALPLLFTRPLSFNLLADDRQAIFSGQGDRFWTRVKAHLRPGDQIATVIEPGMWHKAWALIPYSLTGTADFPAYFRVRCVSGYSLTPPVDQLAIPIQPFYWFGAYSPGQIPAITKGHPELRLVIVDQINPLRLHLSSPSGPDIDLTPDLGP